MVRICSCWNVSYSIKDLGIKGLRPTKAGSNFYNDHPKVLNGEFLYKERLPGSLTATAPEHLPGPERKGSFFEASFFRGKLAVKLRGCI